MNPRNLFVSVASVIVMSAALLMSQGLTDGVKVTLPYPVTVGDVVLEPGEYEIRRPSSTNDQILRFYSNDKMRYQTVVQTIPTEGEKPVEESKVILHHIGDQYYFDKIWMEDKTYGFEFVLPERVRALQRELSVSVPATYQSAQSQPNAAATPAPSTTSTSVTPPNNASEPAPSVAVAPQSPPVDSVGAQNSQDRDIPANTSVSRESSSTSNDQVAALQREQQQRDNTPAAGVDSRQESSAVNSQNTAAGNQSLNNELPATASGWLAYLLAGTLLIATAGLLWNFRAQE